MDESWRPLVDKFGRRHTYLRISLTDRCNFRCTYCMPAEGVELKPKEEILTIEEILHLTKIFAKLGVDKVRLTGGEPTLRKGLIDLIAEISQTQGIKSTLMTTNGSTLSTHSKMYREAGLSGINISLDSLQPQKFEEITRGADFSKVMNGIDQALDTSFASVKLNVVVIKGFNDTELVDFVKFGKQKGIHVRFIEFMPFLGNGWEKAEVFSFNEMLGNIKAEYNLTPLQTEPNAVAKEFLVDDGGSSIGFVTSVTDNFCGGCNRIRLTADGKLKTCLFSPAGTSLLNLHRNGAEDIEIAEAIRSMLDKKWAGHPSMDRWIRLDNQAMVQIGG